MSIENMQSLVQKSEMDVEEINFHEIGFTTEGEGDLCAACGIYTKFGQLSQSGDLESFLPLIEQCIIQDDFPAPNSQPLSPQDSIGHHATGLWIPTQAKRSLHVFKIADNTNFQFSRKRAPFEAFMGPPGESFQAVFSDCSLLRIENSNLIMQQCEVGERDANQLYNDATWACFIFDGEKADERSLATRSGPAAFSVKTNLMEISTGQPPQVNLVAGLVKDWPCSDFRFHVVPLPSS